MKNICLGVLMVGGLFGPPSVPQQAKEKYDSEAFLESAALYSQALETYPGQRAALNFNIAQSYLRADSAHRALTFMSQATGIGKVNPELASMAWNNIGGLHAAAPQQGAPGMPGQPTQPQAAQGEEDALSPIEQALEDFKNALRNNPENDLARYNYELLKRKQQQQQQQQDQNEDKEENKEDEKKDEEKKDDQQKDQQNDQKKDQQKDQQKENQQQENKENKGQNQQQQQQQQGEGQEQKMSMDQAKMLLEAMNQNEKKFLQQLQKSKKKRPQRHKGPEW